ncbi:hypothetical protein CHS0354_028230 [Potamilus streckersoni]|uniref:SAM domain-containing protein n=1 Tax=Potamilus streckersoni TaxID=2493646 RepID=A0AAE0RTL6_9BIVA|nr:hypothetical protein CHS0354_028230 [Potamilus streckersoni]
MGQILSNIGLEHLVSVFRENMVGPQEVENLGNEEFQLLGVSAVGDRVRLKQACRNHIRGTGACSEEKSFSNYKVGDKKQGRGHRNVTLKN